MEQLNLGVSGSACKPNTWEVEAGGLQAWDYQIHNECKALLHHMRLSLKNK